MTFTQVFQNFEWEPLFLLFQWLISRFTDNQVVFVLIAFIFYSAILYKTMVNFFVPWQRIFALFLFFCYPFFYDYLFNGMRQGFAMMLLMLAIAYWAKKPNSLKFYILIISAGFFHSTAFVFSFILFVLSAFKLNFKSIFTIWAITAISFLTGLNSRLLNFGFITNNSYIQDYTSTHFLNTFGGETNKITFFLFSSFFIVVAIYLYKKIGFEEGKKAVYSYLIKCYIGFNSVFLLLGFISFSNRIAAYSWHIIPLLLVYPILHKKKHAPLLLFLLMLVATFIGLVTAPFLEYK